MTKKFVHERLRKPSEFKKGSFRTIKRGKHRIIIGRPKGKTVTRAQAVLHPKNPGSKEVLGTLDIGVTTPTGIGARVKRTPPRKNPGGILGLILGEGV